MTLTLDLHGAEVLRPDGLRVDTLSLADGRLQDAPVGRAVDLSGYLILPGIVDLHGDAFERHVAPRRGVLASLEPGLVAAEAELAANGVTTGYLAQFWSWEGGLRGPHFANRVFEAIAAVRGSLATDLRSQLRFEIHLLEDAETLPQRVAEWGVDYVVFNDHLPHDRLSQGRKPPRLTGQALKAGRSPEAHFAMLLDLHARRDAVPAVMDRLTTQLAAQGVTMGSHDDQTAQHRITWHARGARLSEFPETLEAAQAAKAQGDAVIMGAPNLIRGNSHKGNVSARAVVAEGLCDALASDYHYPSLMRAPFLLADDGLMPLAEAWALVSSGPARVMGLSDRGHLQAGLRADLLLLDLATRRVAGTVSGGNMSYLCGELATRLTGALDP